MMNSSYKALKGLKFRHKVRYWAMKALMPIGLADFEPSFYLRMNPDVAAGGVDPLVHWVVRGRKENRMCSSRQLRAAKDVWMPGALTSDPSKKTLLLVSHEASRTGAPILCLSLARLLQDRFNVAILLLKDGPLTEHFKESCVRIAVVVPGGFPDLQGVMAGLDSATLRVDAAMVNSIVSYPVLSYLEHLNVPSLMLIHEYAAYCKPLHPFDHVVKFANKIVFSAPTTKSNAIEEVGDFPILKNSLVLPQGQCVADAQARDPSVELAELQLIESVTKRDAASVLVIGAGSVNIRKGVDVFIQCASQLVKKATDIDFKFVWVGGGYEPDRDQGYSVYLNAQVKRSGLSGRFSFLNEVADIQPVYDEADVFLLTSRLDPLPNVGVDAICNGLPIFCFRDASGIADILIHEGYGDELVASHMDVDAMTSLVLAHAANQTQRAELRARLQATGKKVFSMTQYARSLGDEIDALLSLSA